MWAASCRWCPEVHKWPPNVPQRSISYDHRLSDTLLSFCVRYRFSNHEGDEFGGPQVSWETSAVWRRSNTIGWLSVTIRLLGGWSLNNESGCLSAWHCRMEGSCLFVGDKFKWQHCLSTWCCVPEIGQTEWLKVGEARQKLADRAFLCLSTSIYYAIPLYIQSISPGNF